ncbi:MAG: hypothetical protein KBH41_18725, partial [Azonexus sp.]|nr:hypothetical protein [Azonexus sp.]
QYSRPDATENTSKKNRLIKEKPAKAGRSDCNKKFARLWTSLIVNRMIALGFGVSFAHVLTGFGFSVVFASRAVVSF